MEILNVGPLELLIVLLLMFVLLGPKEMVMTARRIGGWIRGLVRSPMWQEIMGYSQEIRELPKKIMDDTGLKETLDEVREGTQAATDELTTQIKEATEAVRVREAEHLRVDTNPQPENKIAPDTSKSAEAAATEAAATEAAATEAAAAEGAATEAVAGAPDEASGGAADEAAATEAVGGAGEAEAQPVKKTRRRKTVEPSPAVVETEPAEPVKPARRRKPAVVETALPVEAAPTLAAPMQAAPTLAAAVNPAVVESAPEAPVVAEPMAAVAASSLGETAAAESAGVKPRRGRKPKAQVAEPKAQVYPAPAGAADAPTSVAGEDPAAASGALASAVDAASTGASEALAGAKRPRKPRAPRGGSGNGAGATANPDGAAPSGEHNPEQAAS
jgi:Sec-independent protein translocase protein TatA